MNLTKTLLIFAYDFPPSTGGISRLCYEIAEGQKSYFEEVTVITRKKLGKYQPVKSSTYNLIELPSQRFSCELRAIQTLRKFDIRTTTILTSLWYPEAFLALASGHKNIYSLAHGAELQPGDSKFRKHIWQKLFGRYVLNRIKRVIGNSHFTKTLVEKIAPNVSVEALPLGVDIEQFKPLHIKKPSNQFIISSLSRIHKFKGFDQVLEALCMLSIDIQKRVTWHIGGTGPYLNEFQEKVKETKVHVKFKGFIPDDQLTEFYNQSHIFILFTQDIPQQNSVEGFGLVFLEAQSCGIPVIGTKTGGISDAVEQGNGGWLLEQNDVGGLSQHIARLIDMPEMVKEQSKLARDRCIERFSWQTYNQKLSRLLQ
jgi:phosphatidylinositol alpha-1,6-mannosyltransferase